MGGGAPPKVGKKNEMKEVGMAGKGKIEVGSFDGECPVCGGKMFETGDLWGGKLWECGRCGCSMTIRPDGSVSSVRSGINPLTGQTVKVWVDSNGMMTWEVDEENAGAIGGGDDK